MLEILVVMAVLAILMAKHGRGGRKRSMAGYRKLPFQLRQGIGGIADDAFAGFNLGDSVSEKTWVSSVKAVYGLQDFTVGEGPVVLVVAHSDYSDTEVAEAIEADTAWDTGNLVAREQATRKVRVIGTFTLTDQGEEVLNDGRNITTKLGWMLETGQTIQYGIFAAGGAVTTGAAITCTGYANGWAR